jgi:RimJ/RimL family protein N-acetyltransferase
VPFPANPFDAIKVPANVETPRLLLRTWQPSDRSAFAAINADPAVMEHISGEPMSRSASDALVDRIEEQWRQRGYGLYAVELRETGEFVGFVGLNHHRALPDEVEIGWRLARHVWGRGLATEAALAVRDIAFDTLQVPRLISITVAANTRSLRVMEKIGLSFWREMAFERWQLVIYQGGPADRGDPLSRASTTAR